MEPAIVAFVVLLLTFVALRVRYAAAQSLSSSLFLTMLLSPAAVYLSALLHEHLSGRGSGLYSVWAMAVSLGVAFAGLVGLALNGLVHLLLQAKGQGSEGLQVLRRSLAGAFLVAGAVLAYLAWPMPGVAVATELLTVGRMAASVGVAAWFSYMSYLLWA